MFRPTEATLSENPAQLYAPGDSATPAREATHDARGASREYLVGYRSECKRRGEVVRTDLRLDVAARRADPEGQREASLEAHLRPRSTSVQLWTTNVRSLPPRVRRLPLPVETQYDRLMQGLQRGGIRRSVVPWMLATAMIRRSDERAVKCALGPDDVVRRAQRRSGE